MPWKAGQSGNPGGRPKANDEVKALAAAYTVPAIERLAFWMNSDDPRASVPASQALLDRAWGKPPITAAGEGGDGKLEIIIRQLVDVREE
jgi:hypothetical protein